MSLRLTASRLTTNPLVRRSLLASVGTTATNVHAGVFAWTRPHRRTLQTATDTQQQQQYQPWSATLSFASPESDFSAALENCTHAHGAPRPLPLTWAAALHETEAAVVITTARPPHKVVHVNAAWEALCGYTQDEALYKPIGPLLQQEQPKSHTHQAARHLMDQLQADHYTAEHDAYLENFTKHGRAFLNHVRVGPLYWEPEPAIHHDEPEFLVAVLEEVSRDQVPLRIVV